MTGQTGERRAVLPTRVLGLVAVGCALLATLLGLRLGWGQPSAWALPVLAGAVVAGELATVHLRFGRQRWVFSCTEVALAAALVVAPAAWAIVAVVLGFLLAQRLRRQPSLKRWFNVAMMAAATAAGAAVTVAAGGGVAAAGLGLLALWLVNHGLVAFAMSCSTGRRFAPLVASSAPLSIAHTAGNASIGLLGAWLAVTTPLALLGLLAPLALLWSSYDQSSRRAAEVRLFAQLARGQQEATGGSRDVSAQVVLRAAARLLMAVEVELVVLTPERPVRYVGDEQGVRRQRVDPRAFDQPWVVRALGSGGVTLDCRDGQPVCTAVLGELVAGPDGRRLPLGVLAARRAPGAARFTRGDRRLAEVLSGQAELWLSVETVPVPRASGATALGGAAVAPALAVLRESASRLAALADGRSADSLGAVDPVHEIVEQLHSVERAVAGLLGAFALHAAHAPAVDSDAPPEELGLRSRGGWGDDWTTTGVLVPRGAAVGVLSGPALGGEVR